LFAIAAAVLVAALAGVFDSRLPARLPPDVLLLPQGLLSGLLPRPHSLCGGRATARLSGRDEVPLHPPERAPVLHVRRCRVHLHSLVRRAPRHPLARERRAGRRRDGARPARVRHRRRHAGHGAEHRTARELYLRVPFAASPGGRRSGLFLLRARWPGALPPVARGERAQPQPYVVGVVLPFLGGPDGRLHPPLRHGRAHRHQDPVVASADIRTHDYDVLVIGAGGAGLRAAIEASAQKARVALVCKSLLGKAHTVMAEGGVAAALGYLRETGRFVLFRTGAIVLATGGIGKAWQITSNSWEYTGDGHALAYEAGAELIDMEFVQFHPTGMVWPPGVRGILVTEGVRGEGGVLKNAAGERFMFRYMPDMFKGDFADTEAEADAWVKGDRKKNRRPPELLTRDVVAKAIVKEIQEGRGSPHGGVFLDIASKQSPDYIKQKLPSMYHQFKELAHVDITTDAMEIGPTTHYVMGGVKVDA